MSNTTGAFITGKFLVRGESESIPNGKEGLKPAPILFSDVPLSLWGGIDPETGIVIDATHPLFGQCVSESVLCLPSSRGSCTASQVLLELILQNKAPQAIILRDADGLLCVGAIIAQEVFQHPKVPDILCVGDDQFAAMQKIISTTEVYKKEKFGLVQQDRIVVGDAKDDSVFNTVSSRSVTNFDDILTPSMTIEESEMFDACENEADHMALRVMIRYSKLTEKEPKYLKVTKAHIDGTTYIGPGGLEFVTRLVNAGGKVRVPTTLNAVSADRRRWKRYGIEPAYALASMQIGNAYLGLGCEESSFTCAPYLLPRHLPHLGEQLVWGESNAVVYSNSVLGARTEKYADYLDICCAIVGKVPAAGIHVEENRKPGIVLDATQLLDDIWDMMLSEKENEDCDSGNTTEAEFDLELLFPALGHLCGTLSDGKVPILLGFDNMSSSRGWSSFVNQDHLKAFCAAFGTTGTSPLIHIAGITPEASDPEVIQEFVERCDGQRQLVAADDLLETFRALNTDLTTTTDKKNAEKIDLVALGNPHLSLTECKRLAKLVKETGVSHKDPHVRIMVCLSRSIHDEAMKEGSSMRILEEFGVEFVNDTCWCMMLDPPIIPLEASATILTNSGKYAHYGPGLTKRNFRLGSMADCVKTATTGTFQNSTPSTGGLKNHMPRIPTWLSRATTTTKTAKNSNAYVSQHRRTYTTSSTTMTPSIAKGLVRRIVRLAFCKR